MTKLVDISNLSYSNEFFFRANSKFANWIVGIIGAFVFIFVFWIAFGSCEDAVSGSGTVRPSENISSVHSFNSGKIEKIYFKDGQAVKKGDKLFSLYSTSLLASKENILSKIKIVEERLSDIELISESFYLEKNLVPKSRIAAHTRFKNYFEIKTQLAELCEIHEKNFNTQKLLPLEVITEELTLELERLWRNSIIKLSQYNESFLSQLIYEKESYEQQLDNLKTSLAQVETQLENNIVLAPIDGTVLALDKLNENDFIIANKPVLSIIPPSDLGYEIVVRVRERDVANLHLGLEAKLKLPAFSNNVRELKARVKKISADSMSNGYELFYLVTLVPEKNASDIKKVIGENLSLKTGMRANAKIIVSEQKVFSYILKKLEISL